MATAAPRALRALLPAAALAAAALAALAAAAPGARAQEGGEAARLAPSTGDLLLPLLGIAAQERDGALSIRDAADAMAEHFNLPDEVKDLRYEKSGRRILNERVRKTKRILRDSGLARAVARDDFEATDAGRRCLANPPVDLPRLARDLANGRTAPEEACLAADAAAAASPAASPASADAPAAASGGRADAASEGPDGAREEAVFVGGDCGTPVGIELPPEERMEFAYCEARSEVERELLERIREASPTFFELMVLRVLGGVGYGRLEHMGGPGDRGVDGLLVQDRLGLNRIAVQAKRYREDRRVGEPEIRNFIGSLDAANIDKGIIITTSSFVEGAEAAAREASWATVILVDGEDLVRMMIESERGVRRRASYEIYEVDENFFADD